MNLLRKKFAWPEGKKAAVSITFDDARTSQLRVGIPVLDEFGVKATFYVSLPALKKNKNAWKKVAGNGHEIGNHSLHHPCTGNFSWSRKHALEEYTLEQIRSELQEASDGIEAIIGKRPRTFAYPCGQQIVGRGKKAVSYSPVVAELFAAGRGWRDEGPNNPFFSDLSRLLALEMDGLSFDELIPLLQDARKKGFWLILAGHDIGESGRQTTLTDSLRKLCEFVTRPENKIRVDTVENIAAIVAGFRENG